MTPEKSIERLESILKAFMEGGVSPEELIQATETVVELVNKSQEMLLKKIEEGKSGTTAEMQKLQAAIAAAQDQMRQLLTEVRAAGADDIDQLRNNISAELRRIERLIPELPEAPAPFDPSGLEAVLEDHRKLIENLSILVVGENVRNALEVLPEGEKLAIEAIEGLREELDKRQAAHRETTAIIARHLYQVGDVDVAGANNRATLQYITSTKSWTAGHSITVSATQPTDPKLFDLWFDVS